MLFSCGDRTRTCDLWVMSPTSYQLLHSAISECKGMQFIYKTKYFTLFSNPFIIIRIFIVLLHSNQKNVQLYY